MGATLILRSTESARFLLEMPEREYEAYENHGSGLYRDPRLAPAVEFSRWRSTSRLELTVIGNVDSRCCKLLLVFW